MGAVNSFHTLSTLISSGYACLVDFRQQDDIKSTPVARVCHLGYATYERELAVRRAQGERKEILGGTGGESLHNQTVSPR